MKTGTLRIAVVATVLALAVVLVTAGGCGSSSGGDSEGSGGETGGAYAGEVIAPAEFAVADYAGKPLVVNMFGSWCPPCNAEAPELRAFAEQNPGVQVIGVACQDSEEAAVGFMEEHGLTFPLVVDDGTLVEETATSAFPTTIFYDAAGNEVDRIVGAATLEQFNASLARAL